METASELYKCLNCGKVVSTHNRSGFCSECKSKLNRNERRAITLKAYRQFEKEDRSYQPGPDIENSFECPFCKKTIFDMKIPTECCHVCKSTGRVALYAEEKCKEHVRKACNMHGAYIGCIQGYVKRLCDTEKGIYKRLLTSEELKSFERAGGLFDYVLDTILKTDNAKIKGKPVRLMSIEPRK